MRSYEYMDPLEVLIRKGQDCANCKSLTRDKVFGEWITFCENAKAPEKKRKAAPQSRCHLWTHKQQDRT